MSDVYSERLGIGTATSATFQTIFTVPSGKRYIIKSLTAFQDGAGTARAMVRIVGFSGRLWRTVGLATGEAAFSDDRHLVVYAGEEVAVAADAAVGTVSVTVQAHGFALSDP